MTKKNLETPSITPPQSLMEIPGMGPIRVRALQKAGWNSLKALSQATVEQLASIRGMTQIKAQQILDYLAQFPNLPDSSAPAKPTEKEEPSAVKENPIAPLGAKVLRAIIDLLLELNGTEVRQRLLRELEESAQLAETLFLKHIELNTEQQTRIEGGLLGIQIEITDARGQGKWSKKTQGDLAESLVPYNEVISKALGL